MAKQLEYFRRIYHSNDPEQRIRAIKWAGEHFLRVGMSRQTVEQYFAVGEIVLSHAPDAEVYVYSGGDVRMYVRYAKKADGREVIEDVTAFRLVEGYPISLGATPEEGGDLGSGRQ